MTRVSVWWCTLCAAAIPGEPLYAPPRFELPYHLLGEAKHAVQRINMATTETVIDILGVNRKLLNDWVRRSHKAGHCGSPEHCPACARHHAEETIFPHVNPPRRVDRRHWYDLEQVREAEYLMRESHYGNGRTASP